MEDDYKFNIGNFVVCKFDEGTILRNGQLYEVVGLVDNALGGKNVEIKDVISP